MSTIIAAFLIYVGFTLAAGFLTAVFVIFGSRS